MTGAGPEGEGKSRSATTPAAASGFSPSAPSERHQQYGTFQAAPGDFSQPAIGFPQPTPPPGFGHPPPPGAGYSPQPLPPPPSIYPPHPYAPAAPYYAQGYQAVQGYIPVVEGRPLRMRRLPYCGLGMGWFLFIIGFFLAAIPWYIGAFVLLCVRVHDYREKPGYVACTIAAAIAAIAILLGATKGTDVW